MPRASFKTYEQDFNEINPNMYGSIRVSLLVNEKGHLTFSNSVAQWQRKDEHESYTLILKNKQKIYYDEQTSTCCDGILVCGEPGGDKNNIHQIWVNAIKLGLESFILDFRNSIKPHLPPSRIAKFNFTERDITWQYAQELANKTQGKLWDKILSDIDSDEEVKVFIKLASIYRFSLNKLSPELIKNKLLIPINDNGEHKWIKLSSISEIIVKNEGEKIRYYIAENQPIEVDSNSSKYDEAYGIDTYSSVINAIMCVAALEVDSSSQMKFHILNPYDTKYVTGLNKFDAFSTRTLFLPYWGSSNKYICILTSFRNINAHHPLTMYAKDKLYVRDDDNLVTFFISLINLVNDKNLGKALEEKNNKFLKMIGCKFKSIDWNDYPENCKPNYYVFSPNYGELVLTEELFSKWANIKNSDLLY